MELREYIFKNRLKKKDVAEDLEMPTVALYKYINREHTPCLARAIEIHNYTGGEVAYEEMLALKEDKRGSFPLLKARSHSRFSKKEPLQDRKEEL